MRKIILLLGLLGLTISVNADDLKVKVLKACPDCKLEPAEPCNSKVHHWDQATTWVPDKTIRIHAVNIPEQSEVAIYTDIEVSTALKMYSLDGHVFRAKYAGPGILRLGNVTCENTFLGSNITDTNIVFPSNHWIRVEAGTPIYVHMDVINWTPYTIHPMTQDVYIYYTD